MVMMMIDSHITLLSSFIKNVGSQALKYLTPQLSESAGAVDTSALLGAGVTAGFHPNRYYSATIGDNGQLEFLNSQPNQQPYQYADTTNSLINFNGNSVCNDQQHIQQPFYNNTNGQSSDYNQQYQFQQPQQQQQQYYQQLPEQNQNQFSFPTEYSVYNNSDSIYQNQAQDVDGMLIDSNNGCQQTLKQQPIASSGSSYQDIISTIPIYNINTNCSSADQMIVIPTDINFYVYKVLSWLINYDSNYIINYYNQQSMELIKYSLECAKNVLAAHETPMSFFPLVLYYADKFVNRCGINHKQIFNLLLISSVMCVKFWGETVRVDYQILGKYFNFTGKDFCYMEKLFLNGINFELYVHNNLIKEFLEQLEKEKESFESKCEFL